MQDILGARVDDMLSRAERGEPVWSRFVNEAERAELSRMMSGIGSDLCYSFFGGYEGAERTRLFIYPDYCKLSDISDCITAVEIRGSGYEELKHSSFLGALTSLGIDRAKLGDIVLRNNGAILFADETIARFLLEEPAPLTRVARDTVRLFAYDIPRGFSNPREYKEIFDTVQSPRLDSVVSSLAGIPRERAKALCIRGDVQVNYTVEQRPDFQVGQADIITVRSYGKFVIESLDQKTKKDRNKLIAKKYI